MRKILVTSLAILYIGMSTIVYGEDEKLSPGDYGYRHIDFHSMYRFLKKRYDNGIKRGEMSCCSDGECRVTVPFKMASAKEREAGSDFQVYVDGKWCPAPRDSLVQFDANQRFLMRDDPAWQSFAQEHHVCAGKHWFRFGFNIPDWKPNPQEKNDQCPPIYCIVKGGPDT